MKDSIAPSSEKVLGIETDNSFRCPTPGCGRLLFKGKLVHGSTLQIKCGKCKAMVELLKCS